MTPDDRDRIADRAARELGPLVRSALEGAGRRAAAAISAGDDPGEAFRRADGELSAALRAVLPGAYAAAARGAFGVVASGKGEPPEADGFLRAALRWVTLYGADLVGQVGRTTRELVREVVAASLAAGENPRTAARALRAAWPGVSRLRAERIARTEGLRAANVGATAGYSAARDAFGLTLEKEWVASSDGRTRESHAAADGQRVPFDEAFTVGGFRAMEPLDPALPASESVNCRCTTRVHVVETKAAAPKAATRKARRDAHIRARYRAPEVRALGSQAVRAEAVHAEGFEGEPYAIGLDTLLRIAKGKG